MESKLDLIKSAEEFVYLRTSDKQEEYSIASNAGATLEVWMDIINRYPEMREWVAHNKTVPLEVLKILASDTDSEVRFMVAMKRKLSSELFELLSKDPDESVRQRIACNKKTPINIIRELTLDPISLVRNAALTRFNEK